MLWKVTASKNFDKSVLQYTSLLGFFLKFSRAIKEQFKNCFWSMSYFFFTSLNTHRKSQETVIETLGNKGITIVRGFSLSFVFIENVINFLKAKQWFKIKTTIINCEYFCLNCLYFVIREICFCHICLLCLISKTPCLMYWCHELW